jgi:hypothetical protein
MRDRLQPILDIRGHAELDARRHLADAVARRSAAEKEAQDARAALERQHAAAPMSAALFDLSELERARRAEDLVKAEERLAEARVHEEQRRAVQVEKRMAMRVIERLIENKRDAARVEQERKEQRLLDERALFA